MKTTKTFVFAVLMSCTVNTAAQTVGEDAEPPNHEWEQYLEEVSTDDDQDSDWWEENYDFLSYLEANPININTATREQLEQLPFLNSKQIEDLLYYLDKYGEMKSASELLMVKTIDYNTLRLLRCFVYFGEKKEEDKKPDARSLLRQAKSELMGYCKMPTYEREGDKDGYLGYKCKHWIRYNLNMGDKVKMGIVGSQDSGEPFFKNKNTMGYDHYSVYFLLKDFGRLETLALGHYKLSFGLGLITNTSFSLGKISMLQNMGRTTNAVRAYSSRSEGKYFQGAAATLRLTDKLKVSAFASYRKLDATLNDDGTAATLLYTGYHRTESELSKKHNTAATSAGGNISMQAGDVDLGATLLYTHLGRRLSPNTSLQYKKYYAAGTDFLNASVNYGWRRYPIALCGETAINKDGNIATINTLSLTLSSSLTMMALQRFYSYKYTSLFANSFAEGSGVQNETGIYYGVNWSPNYNINVNFYADYAHFPNARYQVSTTSDAFDTMVSSSVKWGNFTIKARYRLHMKQRDYTDDDDQTILVDRNEHKGRVSLEWARGSWSSQWQVDGVMIKTFYPDGSDEDGSSHGYMAGANVCWKPSFGEGQRIDVCLSGKYFNTDDYTSRVYTYEKGMLYTYSSTSYYGEGIRYAAIAKWYVSRSLMVAAKVGVTDYFDRSTISSDLQEIDGSSACDVEVQARLKF